MAENEKYVTFKWLIGTMLSTLAIAITVIGIVSQFSSKALDAKVNKELYESQYGRLCIDIGEIKESVDSTQKNLEKVLRHLKIEPVK